MTLGLQPIPHNHHRLTQSILPPLLSILSSIRCRKANAPNTISRTRLPTHQHQTSAANKLQRTTHLNQLPLPSPKQQPPHFLRTNLGLRELVVVAFFNYTALVCPWHESIMISLALLNQAHVFPLLIRNLRSSHFARLNPFACLPNAWCSAGTVVSAIFCAVSYALHIISQQKPFQFQYQRGSSVLLSLFTSTYLIAEEFGLLDHHPHLRGKVCDAVDFEGAVVPLRHEAVGLFEFAPEVDWALILRGRHCVILRVVRWMTMRT